MLFFKGKEDMGLEASLKLLDLPPDATVDDANQAYAYLHRMIDLFHQDTDAGKRGGRQEDVELLTCAYERAVAYLSDRESGDAPSSTIAARRSTDGDGPESTDLHFTINFNADADRVAPSADAPVFPKPNTRTVQEAISITTRRLQQAESGLPDAQKAVASATAAVASANRQHESAKQASMDAVVAAKSAKSRALLLEIEAKRAMEDAIAVAEKARDRVVAARQAAGDARIRAGKAREQVYRIRKSEETAAAEAVCAEDRLETEKARLKALTHTLIEARDRLRMFEKPKAGIDMQAPPSPTHASAAIPVDRFSDPPVVDGEGAARQQILSDLLEIEASFKARRGEPIPAADVEDASSGADNPATERRRHRRLVYPLDQRPRFSIDGRSIPILDLSATGMRLEPDPDMARPRIVRGAIAFAGQRPLPITGKVVRGDDHGLGLRLVTHIGNHILDQERLRLSA
jgi:PilZ domain